MKVTRRSFLLGTVTAALAAWSGVPVSFIPEARAAEVGRRWLGMLPAIRRLEHRYGRGNVMVEEFDYETALGICVAWPGDILVRYAVRVTGPMPRLNKPYDYMVYHAIVAWEQDGGVERTRKRKMKST